MMGEIENIFSTLCEETSMRSSAKLSRWETLIQSMNSLHDDEPDNTVE